MVDKRRQRKTAILSLKKSGPELPELLTQFSAGIAGTGLAVLLSVICKLACGRGVSFCAYKLLNTGFGFGLVWLSWAVNKLRDTIVCMNKNAGKLGLKDEEMIQKVDKSLREVYFRAATLLAVAVLRLAWALPLRTWSRWVWRAVSFARPHIGTTIIPDQLDVHGHVFWGCDTKQSWFQTKWTFAWCWKHKIVDDWLDQHLDGVLTVWLVPHFNNQSKEHTRLLGTRAVRQIVKSNVKFCNEILFWWNCCLVSSLPNDAISLHGLSLQKY